MAIYHAYTQTVADGTATSVVRPSDWNSGHVQGFFLAGNTSNASTVTGTDVYFSGGNGVTLSGSNNSIGISVATGFNVSAGTTSNNITQLVFPNSNGVTWGLSSNSLTANIPMLISAANGTGAPATLSFQDGGGVSWSTNANGIQASVAGAAGPLSYFEPPVRGVTTTQAIAFAAFSMQPFVAGNAVSMYRAGVLQLGGNVGSSTTVVTGSVSSQTGTSGTGSYRINVTGALFSRQSTGTNANSSNIVSFASASVSYAVGISSSVSWSTNASSATISYTTSGAISYPASYDSTGGVTSSSYGISGSNSFSSTSTNQNSFGSTVTVSFVSSIISGVRPIYVPIATSIGAGEYWFGLGRGTQVSTTNFNSQLVNPTPPMVMYSSNNSAYIELGGTVANSTSNVQQFWGTCASSITTRAVGLSDVSNNSNYQLWFNMMAAKL
jgi:hypothetical protein